MQALPVNQFIRQCLKLIGVVPEGNQPSPEQALDALYVINETADLWNADGDMIYTMQQLLFPIAGAGQVQADGTTVYTIGPDLTNGANPPSFIVPVRPSAIEFAAYRYAQATPFFDQPITMLNSAEWGAIRVKNMNTVTAFYMYMDEQWPVANIYLWPNPPNGSLFLQCWQPLNSGMQLTDNFSMPPGYARAFRLECACMMAPTFNKPIPPDLAAALNATKQTIKWNNIRGGRLTYSGEAQGVASGSGAYDINTDSCP